VRALDCLERAEAELTADLAEVDRGGTPRFGRTRGLGAVPLLIMRRTNRYWLSSCLSELGRFSAALGQGRAIIAEVTAAGDDSDALSRILAGLAVAMPAVALQDFDTAAPMLETALSVARVAELGAYRSAAATLLGHVRVVRGSVAEGLTLLEAASEHSFGGGPPPGVVRRLSFLGDAYRRAGRFTEAASILSQALALARSRGEHGREAWCLYRTAELASATGAGTAVAAGLYREAMALADSLGMRPLAAHARVALGTLLSVDGDTREACDYVTSGISLYRELGMTRWLAAADAAAAAVSRPARRSLRATSAARRRR